MRNIILKINISIIITLIGIWSCSKTVPTDDLVKARTSIEEMQSNKPEGKSKQYLETAIEELKKAHEDLASEDYEKAKEKANLSYNISRLSLIEWYPTKIEEWESTYQQKLKEAINANAEIHAKEDLEHSNLNYKEAKDILNNLEQIKLGEESKTSILENKFGSDKEKSETIKKLDDNLVGYGLAKEKYNSAIKSVTIAYETSISHKEEYFNQLNNLKNLLSKSKEYNADKYYPEKFSELSDKINTTEKNINQNQLKVAYEDLNSLKIDIDNLYDLSISKYAKEKLDMANNTLQKTSQNVEKNKTILGTNSTKIQETLNAAKEAMNNANEDYKNQKYESSIGNSEEVIKLSKIIDELVQDSYTVYKRNLALQEEKKRLEEQQKQELNKEEVKIEPSSEVEENIKLIYEVKKTRPAECLWRIAGKKEIYNNPREWKKIYDANKDLIKDPNMIYPGQKLKIPK